MADLPKYLQYKRNYVYANKLHMDEAKLNNRWDGDADDDLRDFARNIIDVGQEQPILIRLTHGTGEDKQYTVVFGFRRTKAVRLINSDPELFEYARSKGKLQKGDVFPLWVNNAGEINEAEALRLNAVENAQRKDISPIDKAVGIRRLEQCNYTTAEIIQIYGKLTPSRISQLKKLLLLDDEHKGMVHRGELSVAAALELINIAPGERDDVIAETGGSTTAIKDKVRANGKRIARPLSQVRRWLGQAKQGTYQRPHTVTVLEAFEQYVAGEIDEDSLLERIDG